MNLPSRGTVVVVDLDPTVGHEQRSRRPCLIVSSNRVVQFQRYNMVAVVPLTTGAWTGPLYPVVQPGQSGLFRASCALADQIRAIDKTRISQVLGTAQPGEMQAVEQAVALFLGL